MLQSKRNLRPDLNGNPFFAQALAWVKKDWEWKADKASK